MSTSSRCLEQIRREGLLGHAQLQVYELLLERGPMTGREVDEALSGATGRGHSHKRLPELERFGIARTTTVRPCIVTGRIAHVWEAIDQLPLEERAPMDTCPSCGRRRRRAA